MLLVFFSLKVHSNSSNQSQEVKFNMNMICMQCTYWNKNAWSSDGIEISLNSSIQENMVHCLTYHFSLFKSAIFAPPELLNPIDEINLFSTIATNMVCLVLVIIIFFVYFVVLYWSKVQDKKDILTVRTSKFRIKQYCFIVIHNFRVV